jgi:hypothetical protein
VGRTGQWDDRHVVGYGDLGYLGGVVYDFWYDRVGHDWFSCVGVWF